MEISSEWLIAGLVLAFLVVVQVLRSGRSRGLFGELRVRVTMFLRLDRSTYRSLHNLTLPTVVVFVSSSRFKTAMPPNVLGRRGLVPYIRSKSDILLSEEQVEDVMQTLKTSAISRFGAKRRHLQNLRENQRDPVCPRCGNAMVLRTAKRGSNPGSQFWGCAGYPQCKFTRDVS